MKTIAALLAVPLLAAAVSAQGHDAHEKNGAGSQQLHEMMTKGSQQMQDMRMSGDLDRDFVESMLMHHRHGMEMAKLQLEQGSDAKAKQFARATIENQKKEIKELENWLQAHPKK